MHQVLNPWLPGLIFINVKHRLLTTALNSMSIIFVCLYWKSQGISCGLESGHTAAKAKMGTGISIFAQNLVGRIFQLRNDLYCVRWSVELVSLTGFKNSTRSLPLV